MHLHELAVGDQIYGFRFPGALDVAGGGFSNDGIIDARILVKRMTQHPRRWQRDRIEIEHFRCDFRWIPWVRGKINWCNPNGRDVASGWFSGCWMVRYRDNGNWRVAHVTADADVGFDCKADWRAHKLLPTVDNATEFSPFVSVGLGASRMGFVRSNGDLYAAGLDASPVSLPNPYRRTEDWETIYPGIARQNARDMARRREIDSSTLHPGTVGYRVVEIAGPLATQAFPP